jgi:hypothetical protein
MYADALLILLNSLHLSALAIFLVRDREALFNSTLPSWSVWTIFVTLNVALLIFSHFIVEVFTSTTKEDELPLANSKKTEKHYSKTSKSHNTLAVLSILVLAVCFRLLVSTTIKMMSHYSSPGIAQFPVYFTHIVLLDVTVYLLVQLSIFIAAKVYGAACEYYEVKMPVTEETALLADDDKTLMYSAQV